MSKNLFRGGINSGMLYVIVIMAVVTTFSYLMMGGTIPTGPTAVTKGPDNPGKQEIIFEQDADPGKRNLQLQTFSVKTTCESQVAVNFLIDTSGSMAFGNKQNEEKNALQAFTGRMEDNSVIGIQTFSAGTTNAVPISLYKDVKTQVQNTIRSLPAVGNTQTRDGLTLSRDLLADVISQNKFSDRKYSLVLLTDGIPETANENETNCIATATRSDGYRRCFARAQDPRTPPNIAADIKNMGVEIYSINITSTEKSDVELAPHLEALLKDVASEPISEHYYTSLNGADLKNVLDKVFKNICS